MSRRAAILLSLLLLGACGDDGAAPGRASITIGYSALRISLPVFVAAERRLFEAQGLDVTLVRYETAQPLVEEVLDGRVLAGGFAALPIVFTAAERDGSEIHLALAMVEDEAHPVSRLLRRRGDDTIGSAADLRGRTVGILPTVAYRRWLEALLRHAGVPIEEVTVVAVAPPQQVQALDGGGVDALFTNDPMATAAVAAGVAEGVGPAAPVPAATGQPLVFGSFLVHPRLVRERPDVVARLLAALDDAVALVHADQDAARRAMTGYVRAPERPFVGRYPDARYLDTRQADDATLAAAVRSMVELGVLSREVPVDGVMLRARESGP